MLISKVYDRARAVAYAARWAFDRNPLYYDYTGIGGNCTNFVSQCLLAGSCVMNFTPDYGWYYLSPDNRAAAWTGVDYLRQFLVDNAGAGPRGVEVPPEELVPGDVLQLGREASGFYHSLLVTRVTEDDLLVAAQSDDAFDRPLSSYRYDFSRGLHITDIGLEVPSFRDCYRDLLAGREIVVNRPEDLPPDT